MSGLIKLPTLFRHGGWPITEDGAPLHDADMMANDHPHWQFGWSHQPEKIEAAVKRIGASGGYTHFDQIRDDVLKWDGNRSVPLWRAALTVTGKLIPARKQSRGVCTSCGWASAGTLRRCIQLANDVYTGKHTGESAAEAFCTFSHAVMYGLGKEAANDLGPQNRNERGDGCYGAAMAEAAHNFGFVANDLAHDQDDDDSLAVQYAVSGVPADLKAKAKEHGADTIPITSISQAFDILASGHPIAVCSSQGFTMTRDQDGFCGPQGRWDHCMHWMGIAVVKYGAWSTGDGSAGGSRVRRGPVNGQSWGQMCPDGPLCLDAPDYAFGIDEQIADGMLKMNDTFAVASLAGFTPVPVVIDQYY